MLRNTIPRFEIIALLKPAQTKLTSFIADMEHPATMGRSESQT